MPALAIQGIEERFVQDMVHYTVESKRKQKLLSMNWTELGFAILRFQSKDCHAIMSQLLHPVQVQSTLLIHVTVENNVSSTGSGSAICPLRLAFPRPLHYLRFLRQLIGAESICYNGKLGILFGLYDIRRVSDSQSFDAWTGTVYYRCREDGHLLHVGVEAHSLERQPFTYESNRCHPVDTKYTKQIAMAQETTSHDDGPIVSDASIVSAAFDPPVPFSPEAVLSSSSSFSTRSLFFASSRLSALCMVFVFCASHFPLLVYLLPSLVLCRLIWIFCEESIPKDLSVFFLALSLSWILACSQVLAEYPRLWWIWVVFYALHHWRGGENNPCLCLPKGLELG